MKNIAYSFLGLLAILGISGNLTAQTFTVEVQIKNQQAGNIIFGSIKGDDFTAIDSTSLRQPVGKIKFAFPENAHPGVYRIIFGLTPAAKVLNEPPQQLDFIFDNENLVFDTDFKGPVENLKVIKSKENSVWYEFLAKDDIIRQNIKMIEDKIDNSRLTGNSNVTDLANEYNQLQMERDMFVVQTSQDNKGLFVSQMIKNLRVPVLDGYLTTDERRLSFKKEFFKLLDFSDPALINTAVYSDNIFKYLVMYNQINFTEKQREEEYMKALDIIIPNIKSNDEVYRFLMDYLIHGFNVLQLKNILGYISKKYNYPK